MKNTFTLSYQTATELRALLAKKEISSLELMDHTIARIDVEDQKINAIPVRDFDHARKLAKAADVAIARGESMPLLGLPMTVKECFNVMGMPTTWGDPQFKNWCPEEDALAVSRLKAAGAIIIGKSNVPHMLGDWQTYNDIYGTTNNPWNLDYTPGGSSGGSAAALAAGLVSLELGTDLAGSLRTPAHYCGVLTHKPSQDVIPVRGSAPPKTKPLPMGHELVVAGPMARTAKDLMLAFKVLAGPDELWLGKGYQLKLPKPRHKKLQEFKVLVIDTHPLFPTDSGIKQALHNLSERLMQSGVSVSRDVKNIPDLAKLTQMYTLFLSAFLGTTMPAEFYEKLKVAARRLKTEEDSLSAYFLRGATGSYRDLFFASRTREGIRAQWRALFKEYDVILCPVMPTTAFPHDHSEMDKRKIVVNGKKVSYSDQFIWASIATLLGMPATVVPIALSEQGLPIGVQIIGDCFEDYTTLQFAHLVEQEFGAFQAPIY